MNFMNSTVWQDCITRYEDQIKIAFTSEDEWARFWSGVLTEKGNDIEQRKEAHNRLTLLNRMALADAMGASGSGVAAASTVIDLTAGFNAKFGTNYTGAQLRTTYLKEFLAYFVSEFKIISDLPIIFTPESFVVTNDPSSSVVSHFIFLFHSLIRSALFVLNSSSDKVLSLLTIVILP
jgi:hypothetical protein